MLNVYEQIDRNKQRSFLVIFFFVLFVSLVAWFLARVLGYGLTQVGIALILAGAMSFGSYWWGDKLILKIAKARPANRQKDFDFFTVAENLAMAAGIPVPSLYVIDDPAPNAFATGRDPNHAVVCVTSGLLDKLDRTELEGVVAHEMSHIKNYDIRLMGIVTILVGAITILGEWLIRSGGSLKGQDKEESSKLSPFLLAAGLILMVCSPLIARLLKLAISRRREFLADASAVMLTRYPEGLARALEKISNDQAVLKTANKATAHLYIVNPLKNRTKAGAWLVSLFNTHPPLTARIKALKQME